MRWSDRKKELERETEKEGEWRETQTSAVLGTSSQKISHLSSPTFVCNVTDCIKPTTTRNPNIYIYIYEIDTHTL
jgi:hypothetical protein